MEKPTTECFVFRPVCTHCGVRWAEGIVDKIPSCGKCWMKNYLQRSLMICGVCNKPDAVTFSATGRPICLLCAQQQKDDMCTKCRKRAADVCMKDQRLCDHCYTDWEFEQWLDDRPPKQ